MIWIDNDYENLYWKFAQQKTNLSRGILNENSALGGKVWNT